MKKINNVIKFPCLIKKIREKMEHIRDEVELILSKYAIDKCDLMGCFTCGRKVCIYKFGKI